MKHASVHSLALLSAVVAQLRELPGLAERSQGSFYFRSKAFLHFHEDPAGLFADAKLTGGDFERYPVNTVQERRAFVAGVRKAVLAGSGQQMVSASTLVTVKVKPGARTSSLIAGPDGTWNAQLKAQPVDGKANEELIRLVAQEFSVPRSAVAIKSGAAARLKVVEVSRSST